ncbi:hypothetical protein LTR78_010001 [Recurvomyces mirabilis]|uniref:Uncharacterized protein n=1 Tax=Recurvomyces mirabilis TaxID=574656 RepID=A0AAE0TN08_9PEZI|nr:hypothetical protein LTR78_010001 [Recurvomyces mirabilis]KAK5160342.1 hypothetical protein LTS14_001354 [Recurvomyces mirabilis]
MRSFQSSSMAYANCRRPAKTAKTGFLDLPDEVRHRIYGLAIYDHYRGVVFLPRALPRKVTPQTDLNILVEPTIDDGTLAAGIWSMSGVIEDGNGGYVKTVLALGLPWAEERGGVPCADCLILSLWVDPTPEGCDSECGCDCHELGNGSKELESDNTEDGEDSEDGIHVQPPAACLAGACSDEHCEHCAGFGLGASQNELAYVDEFDIDDEWQRQDHDEEEDLEHFDTEEQVGMLANKFSWRFDWQDYTRSLARFMKWIDVTVGDYAQFTSGLSLEGRHTVEEGIEFVANISFESSMSGPQVGIDTIGLALALPFSAKSCSSSATVRLQKLGTLFIQAMQCVSNNDPPLLTVADSDISAETTAKQKPLTSAKGLPRQISSGIDKETFPEEEDEVEVLFARAVRAVSEEL